MKFSNGCWLNKDGIVRYSPQEVYSSKIEEKLLTLHAPCNRINHRGDTLGGPVITYKISSPMKNVLRIRSYHYMGTKNNGPEFEIYEDNNFKPEIAENDEIITVKSGDLKVNINKNFFSMEFFNGDKLLTKSANRSSAYYKEEGGQFLSNEGIETFMRDQLSLSVGEAVYGLGERFTPFVKNGQSIDCWNEDGGTSTEQSYKNVPFYITNKGYGVFVNHPERVSFEVGSELVTKVQFSVPGETLDYFIITGDDMKEVLENYTSLTGKPALPPAWSFGLWLTTSFTTNYDEETVTQFVDGMAERDIPLHVFHFDCFWMKGFNWCNFEWDNEVFPDPKAMLERLKAKGLKICVWINPYIAQESSLFEEGRDNGYFIKRPNGDVWQWDMWQPGMAIVDFTNPEACKWYADKLRDLMEMGVDCFKTDFGERIPVECTYFDGSDPVKMHNYYTQMYNKVVFDVVKEVKGENEAVLFARSATAGGQQFPVHWGGDCTSEYESMAESLRGGLSLCLSGFGFWSHDIGGFESTSTPDVYKRWAAFGLLSSHSRLHGSTSYRVPWLYDEESCDVVRFFTNLKCSIMPYLFKTANDAATKGIPTMRAMILENQNDPACRYLDRQYMLGDSILVAPIFNEDGIAEYYLPHGTWTNFITGEKHEGGRWITEKHGYLSIPMMIKENSIVAVGANNTVPDYDFGKDVSLEVFELVDGKIANVEVLNKEREVVLSATALRSENTIEFNIEAKDSYSIILRGITEVSKVEGARFELTEKGVKLIPTANRILCNI